ncbi:xylan 1,4-beta-xylosidase [uncultured Prevotella sp.]|uniref:xylan 1,4-beta-xylosidase n=1 Tax=uncultured Prevotella sp. TaxID=159272 RepID=UPI002592A955|nr:xylan 1,4-beta-xylosidase [uncultured Prevotella sp.]
MKKIRLFTIFLFTLFAASHATAQRYPYQVIYLPTSERARDLCKRLTLDEKISLMMDRSPAIPRLGIPEFQWWSEALHGVGRNGYATVFPVTIGMAASFDESLVNKVFTAVSDEARAKNNEAIRSGHIERYQGLSFWTPNINIFRDPRWGRGQETYGEDPFLTTRMGLAVVRGLQGSEGYKYKKLLACAKHFAVHSGPEWSRHTLNLENLSQRDLWETYLPAFKALVQKGKVAEVMCAYQRIDGDPCCGNSNYLQKILRNEWGFKGMVVSDCSAISDFWVPGRHGVSANAADASAKAVIAGTDVECGSNYKNLPEAIKAGKITEKQIDASVTRLLQARFEVGDFDNEKDNTYRKIPMSVVANANHKQLALNIARESMVLLQNWNNVLPLAKGDNDIIVMGPNANDSVMQWGNYSGYPTSTITILKGIREKNPNIKYIQGCGLTRDDGVSTSLFDEITSNGRKGMKAEYWNNMTMTGKPVRTQTMTTAINLSNGGATVFAPGVNLDSISARYKGTFVPKESQKVSLSIHCDDGVRLIVNGDTLANEWKSRARIQNINREIDVVAGKKYNIQIDYFQKKDVAVMQFDIVHKTMQTKEELLAQIGNINKVIFVGGISPSLEGEEMKVDEPGFRGGDRTSIELPQVQRDMIKMLHDAGKTVIYVNCSGSAIGLEPEADNADAILQAWYPGEQGGRAVADVLYGDYNPGGKLPITFYRHDSDLPDFEDYSMANRTYRYFKGNALFPFGYGLSYTTFDVKPQEFKNGHLMVSVTNTGKVAGSEVVQLYIRRPADTNGPIKTLRGYKRVFLQPGESKVVDVAYTDTEHLELWDSATNTMRFIPGDYEIYIGTSSQRKDLKKYMMTISKVAEPQADTESE